jgi:hypothetical protein
MNKTEELQVIIHEKEKRRHIQEARRRYLDRKRGVMFNAEEKE